MFMSAFHHPSAVVESGAILEDGVKVWHFCHVRNGAILEAGVNLGKDVYIDNDVRIGQFSRIQNGVSIYKGVVISSWCFIGPHVIFTNDLNPRAGNKEWRVLPTSLKSGTSIGAGAVIRCGITLGEFCMIGAGAIVTKDVPPFHLALGFPAESLKMICACGQTHLPLGTAYSELVRDCCQKNMQPEALSLASEVVARLGNS
jgi:UDP-2-acetamido-3-amino-2,3-dideoxy-glucuronate N-acetyltransferase